MPGQSSFFITTMRRGLSAAFSNRLLWAWHRVSGPAAALAPAGFSAEPRLLPPLPGSLPCAALTACWSLLQLKAKASVCPPAPPALHHHSLPTLLAEGHLSAWWRTPGTRSGQVTNLVCRTADTRKQLSLPAAGCRAQQPQGGARVTRGGVLWVLWACPWACPLGRVRGAWQGRPPQTLPDSAAPTCPPDQHFRSVWFR